MNYEYFETICWLEYCPWEIDSTWDEQCYDSRIIRWIKFNNGKILTFDNWGRMWVGEFRYANDITNCEAKYHEVPLPWMKEILRDKRFTNNLCRWKIFKPLWKEIKNERR